MARKKPCDFRSITKVSDDTYEVKFDTISQPVMLIAERLGEGHNQVRLLEEVDWGNLSRISERVSDVVEAILFFHKFEDMPIKAQTEKVSLHMQKADEELEIYKKALELACQSIAEWGAYASEYFQTKWGLQEDVKPETHIKAAKEELSAKPQ